MRVTNRFYDYDYVFISMGSSELAWWSLVGSVCGNLSIVLIKRLGRNSITDLVFVSASGQLSDRRPHVCSALLVVAVIYPDPPGGL